MDEWGSPQQSQEDTKSLPVIPGDKRGKRLPKLFQAKKLKIATKDFEKHITKESKKSIKAFYT